MKGASDQTRCPQSDGVNFLHKYMKKAAAAVAALLCGSLPLTALAMPATWQTAEITPGMAGAAYTVVDATREIRDFHVDIIGTLDNGKGSTPMIMAKASGPVVAQAGGILQGMSGSPVYVDGKLVGAVAAGLKEMTPYTFFITPIEEMLPLWSMPDVKNKTRLHTFDLKKYAADKAKRQAEEEKKQKKTGKTAAEKEDAQDEREEAAEETAESERVHNEEAFEDVIAAALASLPASHTAIAADAVAQNAAQLKGRAAQPALVPKGQIFAAGFDAAGMKFLSKSLGLGATQLTAVGGASNAGTDYDASLAPGSAVGVAVVCGDFTVGATGTVTAVDGNKVLAFGHPFLHKGNVNYFMTDATVVGTIAGQSNGMKIANVGNIIGRINQDRETGVAGLLGEFPSVVPVKIHVKDASLGRDDTYGARIAYDEDYLAQLSAGLAYAAMSKTSDSLGESTAQLSFTVRTNAAPDGKFVRKNMFYNTTDVGQVAVGELMQAMGIICADADKEADIIDVQVDVDVEAGRKTATIVSAVPDKTTVRPGETVQIKTTIKPYRKDKETLLIPYTVPENQPDGTLNLDVRGGGMIPVTPLMLLQQTTGVAVQSETDKAQTTADKLKALAETGRNNEIIIAPGAAPQPLSEKEQKKILREAAKAAKRAAAAAKAAPRKVDFLQKPEEKTAGQTKFETGYIIDNVAHAVLKVDHTAKA